MATDPLLARARTAWVELAGVPVAFSCPGGVVSAPASRLCPPQWTGIVTLGGGHIVTVPDDRLIAPLREALAALPAGAESTVDQWRAAVPVTDVLGPATLAYLDGPDFRPVAGRSDVAHLPARHPAVGALLAAVAADEAAECGITEISSAAFVVRDERTVVAVAGYRHWPGKLAHLCVLTAGTHRRRGLARVVASAATADALAAGYLPQWRARPRASRELARTLGFRELGAQLSLRVLAESQR